LSVRDEVFRSWVDSTAGGDPMNSDRFISTLRYPMERKIEANCSPAHPVSEVIWPVTTNPFDVP
jgi:hypothetical protein